jgi:hypothetical protein
MESEEFGVCCRAICRASLPAGRFCTSVSGNGLGGVARLNSPKFSHPVRVVEFASSEVWLC